MNNPYREMCAELIDSLENARRIIDGVGGTLHINTAEFVLRRAHALMDQPVPQSTELTDEEIAKAAQEALNGCPYVSELHYFLREDSYEYKPLMLAIRAAIAADRTRRLIPQPPEEMAEMVKRLHEINNPAPLADAAEIRFEFSVLDEDYTEQAGGTAPTYAQALSEGEHYLIAYSQDGPHMLEVRRVEVLCFMQQLPPPRWVIND
jgi:hypothetical protein